MSEQNYTDKLAGDIEKIHHNLVLEHERVCNQCNDKQAEIDRLRACPSEQDVEYAVEKRIAGPLREEIDRLREVLDKVKDHVNEWHGIDHRDSEQYLNYISADLDKLKGGGDE